ncbi:MAG: cysteine hydrolase [Deltaproteobacteria bacterium]|nr:cysteine hydrolase [Deltaproteobacteria bacterium]MBW2306179.1 cysteine hydrolase [Deltaproteobacteria bacterium]
MKSRCKLFPDTPHPGLHLEQLLEALEGTRGRGSLAGLSRPGLLILDLQRLFTDSRSPAFLPQWNTCRPRCFSLVEAFIQRALPVVFTRHVHGTEDDGFLIKRFFGRLQRPDDPLSELSPDVRHWLPSASVVDKDRHSALLQPEVMDRLAECDCVVITGVQTPLCILATALDAARVRLVSVVVMDATAARTRELHLSALRCLAAGHAHVATTQEVLDLLKEGVRDE